MADSETDALREAAAHRGYRLLRSRKKTPGVGDYGKFGLTYAKGKPVIGVGDKELTASADEIETYLRGGEAATWRQSADLPPSPKKGRKGAPTAPAADGEAAEPAPEKRVRQRRTPARQPKPSPPPARKPPRREPAPEPVLEIRMATPDDHPAIAKLVSRIDGAGSAKTVAGRLAVFAHDKSGLIVAEKGRVIGCLAWTLSPAPHREPAGRIATLVVIAEERRAGIGRALVEAAADHLAAAGCTSIEALSDIAIKSSHGFFRRTGFEETSYRFARTLGRKSKRKPA